MNEENGHSTNAKLEGAKQGRRLALARAEEVLMAIVSCCMVLVLVARVAAAALSRSIPHRSWLPLFANMHCFLFFVIYSVSLAESARYRRILAERGVDLRRRPLVWWRLVVGALLLAAACWILIAPYSR